MLEDTNSLDGAHMICEFYQFHGISHLRLVEIKNVINMLMPFHDIQ